MFVSQVSVMELPDLQQAQLQNAEPASVQGIDSLHCGAE